MKANLEIIGEVIAYIENNLEEPITISDIALKSGFSYYYFTRLFQALTRLTPQEYLLRRRLSKAALELSKSGVKVIDVAFRFQFETHEGFSRSFKRVFGISPSILKNTDRAKSLQLLHPIGVDVLRQIHKNRHPDPTIEQLPEMFVIGQTVRVQDNYHKISRLWQQFQDESSLINRRFIPERFCQVSFWSESPAFEGFYCMAALECKDLSDIPVSMVGKRIAPSRYLRFEHRGLAMDVIYTYQYIFETFLPQSNIKLACNYEVEKYSNQEFCGPKHEQSLIEIYIPIG